MPYKISIDPDVNCSFIKHNTPFDLVNLAKSADDRLADPNHRKNMNFLHDFTDLVIPAETTFKSISE